MKLRCVSSRWPVQANFTGIYMKFYKGYPHAAKYLRKLNALSEKIEDWENLGNHLELLTWLEDVHGKKSSFWRHYNG